MSLRCAHVPRICKTVPGKRKDEHSCIVRDVLLLEGRLSAFDAHGYLAEQGPEAGSSNVVTALGPLATGKLLAVTNAESQAHH